MRRFFYCLLLFLSGGLIYTMIEVAFRGHTHITMFFAGGICLLLIAELDKFKLSLWLKLIYGGLIITAVEFLFGSVFNLALGMGVWDYSSRPWNIMGQICLMYTLAWTALTLPAIWLSRFLSLAVFKSGASKEKSPV